MDTILRWSVLQYQRDKDARLLVAPFSSKIPLYLVPRGIQVETRKKMFDLPLSHKEIATPPEKNAVSKPHHLSM